MWSKARRLMAAFLIAGSLLTGSVAYGDAYYSGKGNPDLAATGLVVYGTSMNGSGFFVKGGYFVTAAHVVEGHEGAQLLIPDDLKLLKTELVAKDRSRDLALFKVAGAEEHWYLDLADAGSASSYYTYGNGINENEFFSKHDGYLVSFNEWYNIGYTWGVQSMHMDRYTFPAYGGSSGSAVLNDKGKVVGVVSARREGDNAALVIPLTSLKEFLAQHGL